jgi:hypothetical protein
MAYGAQLALIVAEVSAGCLGYPAARLRTPVSAVSVDAWDNTLGTRRSPGRIGTIL